MPDELIGKRLGQYEIRSLLGKGGMSTVYLAYQPAMDRLVAIKVLPREFLHDDTFLLRFQQEVRTIAKLEHLHILPVYDVGEDQGIPYLVMRYLPGGTLADRIAGPLVGLSTVVRLVQQMADALDYAHERGIIHRDLKPSNVLLDEEGNAYLADFGIAQVQEASLGLTGSRVIGTPPYVAPEMVRKGETVTGAVDIYALGVITYQLFTGELPFYDPDPMKTLMMHVMEPIPSVRNFDPNLSPAVDAVVSRCLAKTPRERYATAGEFARALAIAARSDMLPPSVTPPEAVHVQASAPLPGRADYAAYPPVGVEEAEEEPRRFSGCLIVLGVFLSLIAGVVVTAFALTGGNPLSLLTVLTLPPSRTPPPTVTLTSTSAASVGLTPGSGTSPPPVLPPPAGGGRLVFASNRDGDYEIYLIDADGSGLRKLTDNTAYDFDPDWSPDGTQIVFATTVDGDAEIAVMNADGSGFRQLTGNSARDADPAWSPDGQWIAFSSDRDGDFEIYIMRPDGSDVQQITFNDLNDLNPTWSPDSSRIAWYARAGEDNDTTELYAISLSEGTFTRLTSNTVLDQWPSWSPDGTRLVFTSAQGLASGRRAIFVYDLSTGSTTALTDGAARDDDPVWSPDGALVAFDSDRATAGLFNLYVLDVATGSLRQLTFEPADDVAPAWQP